MKNFMQEAIKAAEKGKDTWPNPMVGAVVVKEEKIVGKAYHKRFGDEHAEAGALKKAGKKAKGADLFVTLEPCNHYGKQPPCTKAIIKAGIKRVFIAQGDPNKESGNGAKELRKHGITVKITREKEAKKLYDLYITNYSVKKKPLITIKIAMSIDGFISFGDGKKKKISGKQSSRFVQKLREQNDAIIVGSNTVLKDDPKLSVKKGKNPVRVVLDSKARIPLDSKVLSEKGNTIIFCTKKIPKNKIKNLLEKGAKVVTVKASKKGISLDDAFEKLYSFGIKNVLIEPGNKLASELLGKKMFDRLVFIIADREIKQGLKAFKVKKPIKVRVLKKKKLGKDLLLVMRNLR
ncbi:MAG: riboflavin biosynthesis protein RibD [Candidatus Diapherotrites archaeon]|uniref:Riboflavin biosynthesis protein RibD n=1 Tax=Candidatus Iainarchaeum sp. TaxID=3101447 RepID=A0A2D6LQ45_9ARCH|nr:riboflavin biosynthesis protein RibD [Candidatus Diapherotrites archaeon]|tara:strand:- start:18022 stop:19065 length:1044 start_codon:yes stop_codon:yes gene_type:complete